MAAVTIKFDDRQLKHLGEKLEKQIRFATMLTLNQAAFDARSAVQTMIARKLELKTKFLPSSVVVNKATKQKLEAIVGFLERARLAELLEEGGTRIPFGNHIAIPIGARSKSGRVTKANHPSAIIARGGFVREIEGLLGIWLPARGGKRRITLMYVLKEQTKYRGSNITFERTVKGAIPASVKRNFARNVQNAFRSRKR